MRRSFMPLLALVFAFGCAEGPTAPLLQAGDARFDVLPGVDNPPPPFEVVYGGGQVDTKPFEFTAKFFANKPGNVAWLRFVSSETATFSPNARIMSVNGQVSGIGTITVGTSTVNLSDVTTFTYQSYRSRGGVSFTGNRFSGFAPTAKGGEVICCDVVTHQ